MDSDNDIKKLPLSHVMSIYKLSKADLEPLQYETRKNPIYGSSAPPMKLYIEKEVQEIADKKNKQKQEKCSEYEKLQLQKLEKHKINIILLKNEVLKSLVLGDFVCPKKSKALSKKITQVKSDYKTALRFQTLSNINYDDKNIINLFSYFQRDQISNPQIIYQKAIQISKIIIKVLSISGISFEICKYLSNSDIFKFSEAFKEHSFSKEILNTMHLKQKYIRNSIITKLNDNGIKVIPQNILNYIDYENKNFLGSASQKYRQYILEAICFHYNSIPDDRKKLLQQQLQKYKLYIRDDSQLCTKFIDGSIIKHIDEVVAIMRITNLLFKYGHIVWSNNHRHFISTLDSLVKEKGLSYEEAYKITSNLDIDDDDDEYEYYEY